MVSLDATEQEIPRSKDWQKRKTHYSGKRKRPTVKTQITVNSKDLIVHKSRHVGGSTHDYILYKHYLGIKADFPKHNCVLVLRCKAL